MNQWSKWPVAITLLSVLVLGTPVTLAHESDEHHAPPPRVSDAALYQPTPIPDRIILTWTGDPTTSQTVTWRTSTDVSRAFAEIAVAGAGPDFRKSSQRVEAATRAFVSNLSKSNIHRVEFTDLQPAAKYAYRVGDGGSNWSEWFHFRTAPAKDEPFSFVYFGDAQAEIRSMWSRVVREAHADAPRAAFMLHAGDLIDSAEQDAHWGEWFYAGGWINASIPVIATPGNHEYVSDQKPDGTKFRRVSRHWPAQFAFPRNGIEGLETSVYYVDYLNLRVIALDSNIRQDEQAAWLDKVLADNDRAWTVITFHHPIFAAAKDRDNAKLRETWKPVFDRHRVDLVLTGHDHAYGRSRLLMPETNVTGGVNWRSDQTGTVYVVSVSGAKMYGLEPNPRVEFSRAAENTQLYQVIAINGSTLRYESRTATGELYDAFTLKKRPGQSNEMIEQIPDTPARLRRQ